MLSAPPRSRSGVHASRDARRERRDYASSARSNANAWALSLFRVLFHDRNMVCQVGRQFSIRRENPHRAQTLLAGGYPLSFKRIERLQGLPTDRSLGAHRRAVMMRTVEIEGAGEIDIELPFAGEMPSEPGPFERALDRRAIRIDGARNRRECRSEVARLVRREALRRFVRWTD